MPRKRLPAPEPLAWRQLRRGKTLELRRHPAELAGFYRVRGMEPHGQVEDWVRSLPDGSRLHAHVYADGRMSVHRDRFDPERGPLHLAAHVGLETRGGQVALALTAARLLGWL